MAVVTTRGVSLVAVPLLSSALSSPESVHFRLRPVTAALPLSLSTSVTVNVIVSLRAYWSGSLSVVPRNASFSADAVSAAPRAAANARNLKPAGRRAQRADTAIGCVRMVVPF